MSELDGDGKRPANAARNTLLALTTFSIFSVALACVFLAFIVYVSRVNLTAEFQRQTNQNIDAVFMNMEELKRDEQRLDELRKQLSEKIRDFAPRQMELDRKASVSDEYKGYFKLISKLWKVMDQYQSFLDDKYFGETKTIDHINPSIDQATKFNLPLFRPDTPAEQRERLISDIAASMEEFRNIVLSYIDLHGIPKDMLIKEQRLIIEPLENQIKTIVRRQSHLATADEREKYQPVEMSSEKLRELELQEAILRSYQQALGQSLYTVLQFPVIAATMFVTLAMGLLGGIVSFMRVSIDDTHQYTFSELFRRALLGLAAAFGIFLLAGSGLLVLTAQGSKVSAPNAFELSPYFVAFLAFISGFLADDAFARLTQTGRSMFRGEHKDPPSDQPGRTPPPISPAATPVV